MTHVDRRDLARVLALSGLMPPGLEAAIDADAGTLTIDEAAVT